jgi:DNA-binding IclR family transcriptional regulator
VGYADIVAKLEEGLASVSVAIVERGGRPVATLNVTGPSSRFDGEERIGAPRPMRVAVAEIQARLGDELSRDGVDPEGRAVHNPHREIYLFT